MKTNLLSLLIISFLLSSQNIYSQSEAAFPFMQLPTSPYLSGMGNTGTSIPTDDPFAFLNNPAQIGYSGQENDLAFEFYPSKIKWLGIGYYTTKNLALNLGYNFKKIIGIPVSLGFGYANSKTNLSFDFYPNREEDDFNAYSLGVGLDYSIQIYTGITFKKINSKINNIYGETSPAAANANAIDYGFLVYVPVLNLINPLSTFNLTNKIPLQPYLDFSVGYSQLNIGDKIYYVDPAQADPQPRTARLGYGISAGINSIIPNFSGKIIGLTFTVDAEDMLIKYDSNFNVIYQSFIGDIIIGRNILQVKGDNNVVSRAGVKIDLAETVGLSFGHFSGRGYDNRKTNGLEIRTKGLFKLVSFLSPNAILNFLSNHFDIRYYKSNYFADSGLNTKYEGIAFVFGGFMFN